MKNLHVDFPTFSFSYWEYQTTDPAIYKMKKHMHPQHELLFLWDGNITYTIEDKTYHAKKGDLLLIKPSVYHFVKQITSAQYCRFCFMFNKSFADETLLNDVFGTNEIVSFQKDSAIEKLFYLLYEAIQGEDKSQVKNLCYCYLYNILFSIKKSDKLSSASTTGKTSYINTNGYNLINYINNNFTKINKIEDISNAIFLSTSFINHYFKDNLDISPMRFIRNKKILLAYNLIESGQRPTDVYLECGFSNYVTFYRQYIAIFGHPPTNRTKDKK